MSMSKNNQALKFAFDKGYRVSKQGVVTSPLGLVRKLCLKHRPSTLGYYHFNVCHNGCCRPIPVHRLVAYQKYGIRIFEDGIQVRHLNGVSTDNRFENISIGTASDNAFDISEEVRVMKATKAGKTNERKDWYDIDAAREAGLSYNMICKLFPVSKSTLSYRYGNRNG